MGPQERALTLEGVGGGGGAMPIYAAFAAFFIEARPEGQVGTPYALPPQQL